VTEVTESADGCDVAGPDLTVRCEAAVLTTHLPIVDPALIAARMRPAASPHDPTLIVGGEGHSMTDHVTSEHHHRPRRRPLDR
jgi:hypothetical protein